MSHGRACASGPMISSEKVTISTWLGPSVSRQARLPLRTGAGPGASTPPGARSCVPVCHSITITHFLSNNITHRL